MGDCVERVGDGDYTCRDRNPPALEMPGIPLSIPALVMRQHAAREVGIERRERSEYLRAALGMRHHCAAFSRRESGLFVKDVGDCLVDFADVVKESDSLYAVAGPLVKVGGLSEYQGKVSNAPNVSAGHGIVGVDGAEQSLEGGRSETFGANPYASLMDDQASDRYSYGEWRELQHCLLSWQEAYVGGNTVTLTSEVTLGNGRHRQGNR
jgi:hypothetical protein